MEKITRDELEKFRLNFSRCANVGLIKQIFQFTVDSLAGVAPWANQDWEQTPMNNGMKARDHLAARCQAREKSPEKLFGQNDNIFARSDWLG